MAEGICVIDLSENAPKPENFVVHQIDTVDTSFKDESSERIEILRKGSKHERKVSSNRKDAIPEVIPVNVILTEERRDAVEEELEDYIGPHDISYWNCIYIFGVLIAVVLTISVIILIPRDNSILYPENWYNDAIIYTFAISTLAALFQGMDFTVYTGTTSFISFGMFFRFYLLLILGCILVCYTLYLVFTSYLGVQIPSLGIWLGLGSNIPAFLGIWFLSPLELRTTKKYKENMRWFILFKMYVIFVLFAQLRLLAIGFQDGPYEDWQWAFAILTILAREFNLWILSKLVMKMSKEKEGEMASILLSATLSAQFGSMIAVQLVSANNIAVGTFLLIEFLLHLSVCYQVTKLHQNVQSEIEDLQIRKQKKLLMQCLVLDETFEVLTLLVHTIGSTLVMIGPNQAIFRELRNFEDIDANQLFFDMLILIAIEILGSLICGLILQTFCSINLLKEFCYLMKKYWFIVAIRLSWTMLTHFGKKDGNLGSDPTLTGER